jgi:hypothetical protein
MEPCKHKFTSKAQLRTANSQFSEPIREIPVGCFYWLRLSNSDKERIERILEFIVMKKARRHKHFSETNRLFFNIAAISTATSMLLLSSLILGETFL